MFLGQSAFIFMALKDGVSDFQFNGFLTITQLQLEDWQASHSGLYDYYDLNNTQIIAILSTKDSVDGSAEHFLMLLEVIMLKEV